MVYIFIKKKKLIQNLVNVTCKNELQKMNYKKINHENVKKKKEKIN